jgi:ArsR family transcriptional regulator
MFEKGGPNMNSFDLADVDVTHMRESAHKAAAFLRAIGHEGRLMLLCHLVTGEKSVGELESLLDARQAAVSQQLARLRHEGLVRSRRDGKTVYYSIADPRAMRLLEVLYEQFCAPEGQGRRT